MTTDPQNGSSPGTNPGSNTSSLEPTQPTPTAIANERLTPTHFSYLRKRGVSPEVIVGRGYFSITSNYKMPGGPRFSEEVEQSIGPRRPALAIPLYHHDDDEPSIHQLRLDSPRIKEGRTLKFEIPPRVKRGTEPGDLPADVHPFVHRDVEGNDIPLILTEGIPKADALLTAALAEHIHLAPVALTGVTMGFESEYNEDGEIDRHLAEMVRVIVDGRSVVYLCWDADWRTNPNVAKALMRMTELLEPIVGEVFIVDVPRIDEDAKTGVDDWLGAGPGNTLQMLLDTALEPDLAWDSIPPEHDGTETGGGLVLGWWLLREGSHRFDTARNKWMVWDGCRFVPDEAQSIARVSARIARDAVYPGQKPQERRALASVGFNRAQTTAARLLTIGISHPAARWDSDPYLLCVENGIVDLRTSELRPHDPSDLMTKVCGAPFDPHADRTAWLGFVNQVFANDQNLIDRQQRAAGMNLIGLVRDEILDIAFGAGSNGKSTYYKTLMTALGDYVGTITPDMFTGKGRDIHAAALMGLRMVMAPEASAGTLDIAMMKQVVSSDTIPARFLYGEPFGFVPSHSTTMTTNRRPRIGSQDHGTWRRLKFVPFTVTFPTTDPGFGERMIPLMKTAALAWAIEGAAIYLRDGLGSCLAIDKATEDYRKESDMLGRWLDAYVDIPPEDEFLDPAELRKFKVSRSDAYGSFTGFQAREGAKVIWSASTFAEALRERMNWLEEPKIQGEYHWRGFKLKTAEERKLHEKSNF